MGERRARAGHRARSTSRAPTATIDGGAGGRNVFRHPFVPPAFPPDPGAGSHPSPRAEAGRRLFRRRTRPQLRPGTFTAARGVLLPPLLGDRRAPGRAGGHARSAAEPGERIERAGADPPATHGAADRRRRAARAPPRAPARARAHAPALAGGVARVRRAARPRGGHPPAAAAPSSLPRSPLPRRTSAAFQPGSSHGVTPGPPRGPAKALLSRPAAAPSGRGRSSSRAASVPRRPDRYPERAVAPGDSTPVCHRGMRHP